MKEVNVLETDNNILLSLNSDFNLFEKLLKRYILLALQAIKLSWTQRQYIRAKEKPISFKLVGNVSNNVTGSVEMVFFGGKYGFPDFSNKKGE